MTTRPTPRVSFDAALRMDTTISRDHQWLADRARNAMRHPLQIGLVAAVVFFASVLALVVYPQQQRGAADRIPAAAARVDTVVLLARDATNRAELATAERTVDSLRMALSVLEHAEEAAATARSARRGVRATTRDSVTILLADLTRLIDRATNAPLLASYRALAAARALAGDTRVQALADSLADIERRREAYGTMGGVDPVYVGLTAQAAGIGRTITVIADRRRATLRSELAVASSGVFADAPAVAGLDSLRATLDTATALAAVDSLRNAIATTSRQLDVARVTNARILHAVAAARERANIAAPPVPMLAATLALGAVLGIVVSLLRELASPRLSGAAEVERILGVRVLGALGAIHDARSAEAAATRISRRLLSIGDDSRRVAVIGEDPDVVATVALALATSAAMDARAVLVVDTDSAHAPVQQRLRRRGAAGVTNVLTGSAEWAETLRAHVGSHALPIDLVPPGAQMSRAPHTVSVERAGTTLAQYVGGWDLALFAVTSVDRPIMEVLLVHAGVRDAITCARVGDTELATLVAEHRSLERNQMRHRGVVLADGTDVDAASRVPDQPVATVR